MLHRYIYINIIQPSKIDTASLVACCLGPHIIFAVTRAMHSTGEKQHIQGGSTTLVYSSPWLEFYPGSSLYCHALPHAFMSTWYTYRRIGSITTGRSI